MISIGTGLAIAGASLALGIAGLSTAIGCRNAGVAGAGAVAENKDNFKNSLVFQALPQTQTIYAFIIGLFIVIGTGLLAGGNKDVSLAQGFVMFGSALVVALTGLSAIFQGLVAAAGISASAKAKHSFVPGLIFTGQCETPAIFGFILALIILVVGLNVLG
ncbi:V-type ATP synthase subunit K [Candidatus Woesearchaeota archaeon CG08_land_8_20_14_0_20_43_7]|nr:MAG: V-type ATP synthase subunit K [Candidatus Woesearchaeota archaeon CG08_land_8_20_14_0_20_43_7]